LQELTLAFFDKSYYQVTAIICYSACVLKPSMEDASPDSMQVYNLDQEQKNS
jgi:hypothetical protein